jgi:hypothetical protein
VWSLQPPINGYRVSVPGVNRTGCDDTPTPFSAEVKERVEPLLLNLLLGLLTGYTVDFTLTPFKITKQNVCMDRE